MEENYEQFIQRILNKRGRHGCGNEYHEKHHIKPRCLEGGNEEENLIDLYAREHFIAHEMLAKENPTNRKLQVAWWMMAHIKNSEKMPNPCTPEEYEEARKNFIKNFSGEGHPLWGKHHSEESIQKMKDHTIPLYGEDNPFYGHHHTEESRIKMSQKRKGTHMSEETKKKISEANKGKEFSEEHRKHLSEALKGKPSKLKGHHLSEETKRKISEANKGEKAYWYGKKFSDEVREKISKARTGAHESKETRDKISKALSVPIRCVETGEIFSGITEAERQTGFNHSNLVACLKGRYKTCGGFHWEYVNKSSN